MFLRITMPLLGLVRAKRKVFWFINVLSYFFLVISAPPPSDHLKKKKKGCYADGTHHYVSCTGLSRTTRCGAERSVARDGYIQDNPPPSCLERVRSAINAPFQECTCKLVLRARRNNNKDQNIHVGGHEREEINIKIIKLLNQDYLIFYCHYKTPPNKKNSLLDHWNISQYFQIPKQCTQSQGPIVLFCALCMWRYVNTR